MAEVPLLVIDASVGTKWFLKDEEQVTPSLAVKRDFEEGRLRLFAPDLITQEVASALSKAPRRMDRREPPTYTQAWQSVLDFQSLGLELISTPALMPLAFALAARHACSYYDALYLALAARLDAPMIHADDKLRRTLRGRFPLELWIEDYRS